MKPAYHYHPETLLYLGTSENHKIDGYDDYQLPQCALWAAPPEHDVELEQCKADLESQRWIVELKLVKVTAYLKIDCNKSKEFADVSVVNDEYTTKEPLTQFDEWSKDNWVTNLSNQYIHDYNQVDEMRRTLYAQRCDPLVAEANIKRLQGHDKEAQDIEEQVLAAREQIQTENPFPLAPTEE